MEIASQVRQQHNNLSLLSYLTSRFTYLSESEWQGRITEGLVLINGCVMGGEVLVKTKDTVTYLMPDFVEPEADLSYTIIYEDASMLAINKPGNLLVHKQGRSIRNNLIYHLRENHIPAYPEADIVNRLDRHTSGIVLVSQSKEILAELQALFLRREVQKVYVAVVAGVVPDDQGCIDMPIGPLGSSRAPQKQGPQSQKCKEAITEYRVAQRYATSTLLALSPKTGRTHQLRVHCAALGYPIVGDALYTLSEEDFVLWREGDLTTYMPPINRQALHCSEVHFTWRGEQYDFYAPLPEDMGKLVEACESGVKI